MLNQPDKHCYNLICQCTNTTIVNTGNNQLPVTYDDH